MGASFTREDEDFMRRALALAAKGYGATSPNPMVGAVVVRNGEVIGEGWHKRAGEPHAEINALSAAKKKGFDISGSTIYVTLEPCSTFGRTPACTDALIASGITRVVVGIVDPNPKHSGAGFRILRKKGITVEHGLLRNECARLNEAFNYWVAERQPFVVLKCATSLDGKIAANSGQSKWITGEKARAFGMKLRVGADAILCGINTVVRDDPSLTIRPTASVRIPVGKRLRRVVLDPEGRISLSAKMLSDEHAGLTTVAVSSAAPPKKVRELEKRVRVIVAPLMRDGRTFKLKSVIEQLGSENVTSILVEGGGETHANFLAQRLANRVYFFYAPLIITGRNAPKSVGGKHTLNEGKGFRLTSPEWQAVGPDLLLTGLVRY